jgi:hypothetical protein
MHRGREPTTTQNLSTAPCDRSLTAECSPRKGKTRSLEETSGSEATPVIRRPLPADGPSGTYSTGPASEAG